MGKKRVQLSLSVVSDNTTSYERIHHNETGKTQIVEHPNPTSGSSSVSLITRPYEYRAERTVDGRSNIVEKKPSSPAQKKIEGEYDTSQL